ncbi:MAG: 3'-5' exonuclease [Vibrio ordalii]|uniref:3'-5' exonuclease n=1 Tax=Vibrio ordalii TaxID=28174 RepID=UPI003F3A5EB6
MIMMIKQWFQQPSIDWVAKYTTMQSLAKHPLLKDFYSRPVVNGATPLNEIEFVALDFETTGLSAQQDDIITIGLVPFTLNRIYLNRAKHWVVRPRKALKEDSVVIHGITHNDILDAPDLTEVQESVLKALSGKIVVVHYRHIERSFLNQALKVRLGEGIEFPVIDTLQLETEIQRRLYGGLWNKLSGKKPQSVRLGQARSRYGLPAYTPHHALVDAIATAELFQAQVAHHFDRQQSVRTLWL